MSFSNSPFQDKKTVELVKKIQEAAKAKKECVSPEMPPQKDLPKFKKDLNEDVAERISKYQELIKKHEDTIAKLNAGDAKDKAEKIAWHKETISNYKEIIAAARGKTVKEEKKMKDDPCWDSHEMIGHKMKDGKKVPNCVKKEEKLEEGAAVKAAELETGKMYSVDTGAGMKFTADYSGKTGKNHVFTVNVGGFKGLKLSFDDAEISKFASIAKKK